MEGLSLGPAFVVPFRGQQAMVLVSVDREAASCGLVSLPEPAGFYSYLQAATDSSLFLYLLVKMGSNSPLLEWTWES